MEENTQSPNAPMGIMEFFESQSKVLLAQFMNIEQLLGTTNDYTAPGTHCEVLLRDFLRKHLPSWIGVDRGFIYGRIEREGIERHCPEVDILLHDTHLYRPVFQLEDFVIVQPEAVMGIIQVKRKLSTDQFRSGVTNVVDAKRHLLEMYFQKEQSRSRMPDRHVFSAVVEFNNQNRRNNTFKDRLQEAFHSQVRYTESENNEEAVWVLPSFIGSFSGIFSMTVSHSIGQNAQGYATYSATQDDRNVGLQSLLYRLTTILWNFSSTTLRPVAHEIPPFSFPNNMLAIDQFEISGRSF